jgi:hypothetical protein
MGELARSVLQASSLGQDAVIGFIPARLSDLEVSGTLLGRTKVVNDMHERKAAMAAEAEAFIALPGGCATMQKFPISFNCCSIKCVRHRLSLPDHQI